MRVLTVELVPSAANAGTAGGSGETLNIKQVTDLVLERDVVAMRQLDSKYLALVTNDSSIDLLSLASLSITESTPIPSASLVGFDDLLAVSHNLGPRAQLNYTPSITSLVPQATPDMSDASGQLVSLGENNTLYAVALVPAAHRLLALAMAGDVPKLVHFALDWVFHGCSAYAVGNAPNSDSSWEVVDDAANQSQSRLESQPDAVVVDLICSAALQALRATLNPTDDVPQLMHLLASVPGAEPFMYAQFADAANVLSPAPSAANDHDDTRHAYTHNLSRLLLDNLVTRTLVPPAILSAVLADLVGSGNVSEYTRLLRVVDVAQVDVDAAVRVCQAQGMQSALVHLYVVMGQVHVGLESVPRDVAVGFVVEAVEGSEYKDEEVHEMVAWVVERVPGLLVKWHGDIGPEGVSGELVARCVQAMTKRSSRYRDMVVTQLKRIRTLQTLEEEGESDAANVDAETESTILDVRRAFASALLIVAARDFPQDVALTSAEYFAILTQIVTAFDPSSTQSTPPPPWSPCRRCGRRAPC
ncbi:hypothetical protein BCR44DRAFT_1264587 [Catenaria anguillulae PL171]|uniref:Vacuolar protein sorting-associated protein 8 central domain-containing protein n=1 Tax=Catenaria anguillulae PL171 TaxID=765915 RepID=A0A1Y2HEQ6_9FUNG|nr:hypothetical protein BCR44DRAFT_1264587 [Catenaria anguillulae PL171]